jgi:hypothetical protein
MANRTEQNKRFLTALFAGPFRGHGIIMDHQMPEKPWPGDVAVPGRPVAEWVPFHVADYEARLKWHEALDDDSVPYVKIHTGTHLFAAAFGCPVHVYADSPACARPLVTTAEEADALKTPTCGAEPLARVFELAERVREAVGPDVPISVPDIQSPFDIAALVWKKDLMYLAMCLQPDAVKRLVEKCHSLLADFLSEFKRRVPNCNLCHCPTAWAPPELGCWLSEDEAGSMSTPMFEEFCLPSLRGLSETFGGMFVHCCAAADHQYGSFLKIPNLRGLNRVFQAPGPRPAVERFAGRAVLIQAWTDEQGVSKMLDMAKPESRFLFNMPARTIEEQKPILERLRKRCPRR